MQQHRAAISPPLRRLGNSKIFHQHMIRLQDRLYQTQQPARIVQNVDPMRQHGYRIVHRHRQRLSPDDRHPFCISRPRQGSDRPGIRQTRPSHHHTRAPGFIFAIHTHLLHDPPQYKLLITKDVPHRPTAPRQNFRRKFFTAASPPAPEWRWTTPHSTAGSQSTTPERAAPPAPRPVRPDAPRTPAPQR